MRKLTILGICCVATLLLALVLTPTARSQSAENTAAAAAPRASAAANTAPLPSVTEILQRNEKATGEASAWNKMSTRSMKGIYQTQDASGFFGIEILQKSPNKSAFLYKFPNDITVRDVCDGKSAWLEDPRGGYHAYAGAALASRLRQSEFSDRARMILLAATGKVIGVDKVGTRSAYVVEFSPQKSAVSRIYFDTETAYELRSEDTYTTPDGPYKVSIDMDDYRDVAGLKIPFRMRRTEKGAVFNIRLTQVKFNTAVDDSEFVKPESASNAN
jgi:outer membrane lipoprotein-sorting protein